MNARTLLLIAAVASSAVFVQAETQALRAEEPPRDLKADAYCNPNYPPSWCTKSPPRQLEATPEAISDN